MKKLIQDGNGYQIIGLDNIKEDLGRVCSTDKNNTFYYKDYQFKVWRVKNDINGNPVYRLQLSKDFEDITYKLSQYARYYKKNNFVRLQSYDIAKEIEELIEKLELKK